MKKNLVLFIFLFFVSLSVLHSQSTPPDPGMNSTQFDMSDFPQWTRDLRRAEIIMFGSFPFTYFFSNFGFDTYRWIKNNDGNLFSEYNRRYAPWPLDSAGSIGKTQDEKILTLGIAAGGALLIALVDFGIERYKRSAREREIRNYPEGTPIIIKKPLYAEEDVTPDSETGIP